MVVWVGRDACFDRYWIASDAAIENAESIDRYG